jgi:hypothetical protein
MYSLSKSAGMETRPTKIFRVGRVSIPDISCQTIQRDFFVLSW